MVMFPALLAISSWRPGEAWFRVIRPDMVTGHPQYPAKRKPPATGDGAFSYHPYIESLPILQGYNRTVSRLARIAGRFPFNIAIPPESPCLPER
jgi:hypothetical protein